MSWRPLLAALLAAAFGLAQPASAPPDPALAPPGPLRWQCLFDCFQDLLKWAGREVPDWVVHSARITYHARKPVYGADGHRLLDAHGQPRCGDSVQSGRVFFPPTWRVPFSPALPLVLYTHATVLTKQSVASRFGGYEWFVAAAAAVRYGVAVAMPDLPGLGEDAASTHPFCHAAALGYGAVDCLPAVRDLAASDPFLVRHGYRWSGQLYVIGYSEGGYAALAAVKELERRPEDYGVLGFRLAGSACMAGPFDLSGTTRDDLLRDRRPFPHPFFVPYVILGWRAFYGDLLDPREAFAQRLLEPGPDGEVVGWYDGRLEGPVVDALLARRQGQGRGAVLYDLFSPAWAARHLEDPGYRTSPLRAALEENDLWRGWAPRKPILFAHSRGDTVVPVRHTLVTVDRLAAAVRGLGQDPGGVIHTRFLGEGGLDHGRGLLSALPLAFGWFNGGLGSPALRAAEGEAPPGLEEGWPERPPEAFLGRLGGCSAPPP